MIIAIDGPSGVGKSTLAKKLSNYFHIPYLDTGKMYRAFSLKCVEKKIDIEKEEEVEKILPEFNEVFPSIPLEILNSEEVGKAASIIARYKNVRKKMVFLQREFGQKNGCIVEGRDTTTVIFPETPYKFFLYAKKEVRIWRRFKQIGGRWEKIAFDIEERDKRDRERKIAPLKIGKDVIPLDSSDLNEEEIFKLVLKIIKNI